MKGFVVPEGMENRTMMAINKGKINKAVVRDGVNMEMLNVDAELCAKPLRVWWKAFWQTKQFPKEWKLGLLYPLYKHRDRNTYLGTSAQCYYCHT